MKKALLNFGMPLAAAILAIGGALAFDSVSVEKGNFIPQPGYVDRGKPCEVEVECSTIQNPICMDALGNQAFGIDEVTKECNLTLYMP